MKNSSWSLGERRRGCVETVDHLLKNRSLLIASNRGPVSFQSADPADLQYTRGSGGLVTALIGLAQHVEATWVACAQTEADTAWGEGAIQLSENGRTIRVRFVSPDAQSYDGYYNVISNPILWFLQHNMWDLIHAPTFDRQVWEAWDAGYCAVNQQIADAIVAEVRRSTQPPLILLQDYHLYLVPHLVRRTLRPTRRYTLSHFIHIPWPGPEDWGFLPPKMRLSILESLCALDLIGFQTREDGLNFIRTVKSHLPKAHVNFKKGRVWYQNHATHVRDFPISIDVPALQSLAATEEVSSHCREIQDLAHGRQLIIRVDRTEPSKNIVRGFQSFGELLELHPEHRGKVMFLAVLVPSRLEVLEYQSYLDELMAAAGRVNASFGDSSWEPIRLLVGEDYARAVAVLQLYDVLLVNSIADGMNLVAKEGPVVNNQDGVVILSERTGARQQLQDGALVISPCDVYATAEALYEALTMPLEDRQRRAKILKTEVINHDISDWFCNQLEVMEHLKL